MSKMLTGDDVRAQSRGVWGQFGESVWIPNATQNAKLNRFDARKLEHVGIGKYAVLVAMGSSLEDNIDTLKEYRDRVDVICCDKAFGPLLDHGVKADYVFVADASIPFRFIEPWIRKTEGVTLLATPYANPLWTKTWLGPITFYVNQDSIESEQVFLKIMGNDVRTIPAGSNVSNTEVVFWTDCNVNRNANWGGYEKYFLVGFDYSWPSKGNYYAWDNPVPKRYYMNHRTVIDMAGNVGYTSENLVFSAKWLYSYVTAYNLPVVNCSGKGILDIPQCGSLKSFLSRIPADARARDVVRGAFDTFRDTFMAYRRAEENFNLSRRELLWL